MEVAAIGTENQNLDVVAIYEDTFISLTERVAAIELYEVNTDDIVLQEKYVFLIHTAGAFVSALTCEIDTSLLEQIALNLNKGEALLRDEKILYITEYLNIVCGRAVSSINEVLKSASRITVPKCIMGAEEYQEETYLQEDKIGFATKYGNMQIVLKYNYETQRRQDTMTRTVLVIDDSPFIASLVREGIEGEGYKVIGHARSGEEGITMCEELKPEIVLLDIIMPGIDGFETAQEIQKKMPEVRIIMLSSLCDNETMEEVKKIGLKYLIPKPLEKSMLMATLEMVMH